MKRVFAVLLLSLASTAYALPNCPSDQNQRYDNCFGTFTFGKNSEWAGDKYVGGYKDGKRNGQGTYTFADGDKYVGGFKDGKYHGQGTFTFGKNSEWAGDKFVGEFKDDKFHGQGTYTFVSGRKETGYFMNGDFVPDICEGMGMSKGTSEFGQCVLKLIDKL